ncbi:hypothetical protein JCM18750_38550 [Halostagnicola bangensis]
MSFVSEIEAMSLTGKVQRLISIDKKLSAVDIVFLAEFVEKDFGETGVSRRNSRT